MIDHVNAHVLVVRDVRKCAEFYREKLGFKQMEIGDDFAYLKFSDKPGAGLALVSAKGLSKEVPGPKVEVRQDSPYRGYLAVFLDDANHEFEELSKKGVKFVVSPTTRPDGQRYAFFEDPEGNLWEISHFPKD
jgi:catechol 2,3-dioxygenase-like lactoylglutathione lyase family enzyme